MTGVQYTWPFPPDQIGVVWLFVPAVGKLSPNQSFLPDLVCFVRQIVSDLAAVGNLLVAGDRVFVSNLRQVWHLGSDPSSWSLDVDVATTNKAVLVIDEVQQNALLYPTGVADAVPWACVLERC